MLALDARLHLKSRNGDRWIDARDFFVGALTTALRDDEMLVEVELPPLPPHTGTCFMEVARRRGDYAMMGVAAMVTLGKGARLAFCNAGQHLSWLRSRNSTTRAQVQKHRPARKRACDEAFQRHLAASSPAARCRPRSPGRAR